MHTTLPPEQAALSSSELLAAIVTHFDLLEWGGKCEEGPGHSHDKPGHWDKDGSKCEWCDIWQQARKHVAANAPLEPPAPERK